MENTKKINLSVDGDKLFERITAVQNDKKTRFLNVALFSNGQKITIPNGVTVTIAAVKPDKTKIFNNGVVESDNTLTFELTNQMLAAVGTMKCQIKVIEADESILSSVSFDIEIEPSYLDENSIESTNEFSALTNAIASVANLEETYAPRLIALEQGFGNGTSQITKGFEVRTSRPTGDDLYPGRAYVLLPNESPTAPVINQSSVGDTIITIGLVTSSIDVIDGTITKYNVYKNGVLHASDVTLTQGDLYQVTGLSSGTLYDITLKAKDSNGALSTASNTVSATTTGAPVNTAPTVPTGLNKSNITPTSFTLSWTASTDAQGNPITYIARKNGTVYQSDISGTNLSVTGQTAGSTDTWTISATDGTLESAQSNGLSVTLTALPIHEYLMNEASGTSVGDTGSGTVYNGTTSGTTIVTGLGGSSYARQFNGTSDEITFTNQVIPLGAKTIIFRMKTSVKPTGVNSPTPISNGGDSADKHGTGTWINSNGTISFVSCRGNAGAGVRFIVTPLNDVCDGVEHLIKLTWDGTTNANGVKVYIDDMVTPKATGTAAAIETVNATNNLKIGNDSTTSGNNHHFNGILGGFQIYNSVV